MRLETQPYLDRAVAEAAWKLYNDAFADLRAAAVQRHVMTRGEFDEVVADKRVEKYLSYDDARRGRLCALATFTNDLAAVPLISPEYFARRWPQRYAQGRIWYIGFVAVHPDYHGTGVFARIVGDMTSVVAAAGGVAALDICRRNEEVFGLPAAVSRLLDSFADGVVTSRLDEQTYWAHEFPETAVGRER